MRSVAGSKPVNHGFGFLSDKRAVDNEAPNHSDSLRKGE